MLIDALQVDEIITQFEPEDFEEEVATTKLAQLAQVARVCDAAQKSEEVPVQTTEKVKDKIL